MRIALCQLDTKVGGFIHNVDKVCEFVGKAASAKAELAILPELCLSSYPPLDLLDRPGFVAACAEALQRFLAKLRDIPGAPKTIVLGSVMPNPGAKGRAIQNAAVLIHDGVIV